MTKTLVVLFFIALSPTLGFGELQWEQKTFAFRPTLEQKEVSATFRFKNVGKKDVAIKKITHGCGCILTKAEKKTYKPGEGGEIVGKFIFENRIGFHSQKIEVRTDDTNNRTTILYINAHIPELYKITPKFVFWKKDGEFTTKKISIKKDVVKDIKLGKMRVTHAHFKVELKVIKENEEFELLVTPTNTSRPKKAYIQIETDWVVEGKGAKTLTMYAYVK